MVEDGYNKSVKGVYLTERSVDVTGEGVYLTKGMSCYPFSMLFPHNHRPESGTRVKQKTAR